MSCEQMRVRIGAEPGASDAELEAHIASCESCRAFRDEMQTLDRRIRRVLTAQPPALAPLDLRHRRPARERLAPAKGWLALAASLVLAFAVGVTGWIVTTPSALAMEVVTHTLHEPDSWNGSQEVSAGAIESALTRAGLEANGRLGSVTYASSCLFQGRWVAHFVVRTSDGPITVIVVPGERVDSAESFSEEGFDGLILPIEGGMVAALSRGMPGFETHARTLAGQLSARRT